MVAAFCLRLAWGLIVALLLVPAQAPARFFRVQYIAALVPLIVAGCFLFLDLDIPVWTIGFGLWLACCIAGSIVASPERSPLMTAIVIVAILSSTWVLVAVSLLGGPRILIDAVTSGALL